MAEVAKKTINTQSILVVLLIIASFLIGSLFTKVQYLEKGVPAGSATQGQAAAQGKYKSFEDAMSALAKEAGLDAKKLVSCMNSGEKQAVVQADTAEGEKLGVSGTPGFFVNGKLLAGAFPFESFKEIIDKEIAGTGSTDPADYSQTLQDAAREGGFVPVPKAVSVGTASTKGTSGAPVTVIEYSDFQCPFCARAFPTVQQILREYSGKVQFVYKHFPLVTIHPRAQKTAEASECAKDQGKFWEFHDKLFEAQNDWANL